MNRNDPSRGVSVHLLPSLIPDGSLSGGIAVVVDVLRATSLMVHALAAGANAIVPCLEIDEAKQKARELPPGSALLAGERQGVPILGFNLGNSPRSCDRDRCAEKTIVMTTTNGTRAVLAALKAERVLIGAFVNISATTNALIKAGRDVHIICSGTDGFISLEDSLLAGAIAARLIGGDESRSSRFDHANDSALIVDRLYRSIGVENPSPEDIRRTIVLGRGGRRVTALGLAEDIDDVARVDRFDLVCELKRDPLRIVSVP
jgi:2-phosphosulfolactate phosphatase